jgi:hypothetical protein
MKILKRRPGVIYAIRTGYTGWRMTVGPPTRLGYVGKTTQRPYTRRIDQHRRTQPWSDLIVSHRVLWSSESVTAFGLWWREIYYILTRFPVYNYQWNRLNPRRVPVYRAAAERSTRQHFYGGRMWTR